MSHILGISNHSPDQLLAFLLRRSVITDMSKVAIVPCGTLLKPGVKPVREHLFIVSVSDLYRNLTVLNSALYAKAKVFVFASPLRINEMQGAVSLDFEEDPANRGVSFILKKELSFAAYTKALRRAAPLATKRLDNKYLTVLIDTTKHGSLLNPLMTFIYTLPGSACQLQVKEAIASYLYNGIPFGKLEQMFLQFSDPGSITQKHRDRMRSILVSEIGDRYRDAFKEYRTTKANDKPTPFSTLCKTHGTAEYEMRYLKAVVESKVKTKGLAGSPLNPSQARKA